MRLRNLLFLLWIAGPSWADDPMAVGDPLRYRPVSEASLANDKESLHGQPMTPAQAEEQAARIHEVRFVRTATHASSVIPAVPPSLPKGVVVYSRPDLETSIEIRLSDDPSLRFTRREIQVIDKILASMPSDFLHGITFIESRRYVPAAVASSAGKIPAMKLAEAAPDGLVIYARPMVPDLLPEAIVLHYKASHDL